MVNGSFALTSECVSGYSGITFYQCVTGCVMMDLICVQDFCLDHNWSNGAGCVNELINYTCI